MFSKAFRVRMRRIHRWAGITIGIQLLLWVVSGAYFAWISMDFIKGEDKTKEFDPATLSLASVVPLSSLTFPKDFQLTSIHLESTPRGMTYRAVGQDGKKLYFSPTTGAPLDILSVDAVLPLAALQEQDAAASDAILIVDKIREFNGPLPVYQIPLTHDGRQTRLYVDPYTGRVLARRNRFWRVYDFLWMLHIMDFKERTDTNNILLKSLSLGALGVILTGYFLVAFGKMPVRSRKDPSR